jgi:CHAT domain-containing protein
MLNASSSLTLLLLLLPGLQSRPGLADLSLTDSNAVASPIASEEQAAAAPSAAEVILTKEKGWKQDYETYFGGSLSDRLMSAAVIQQKLRQVSQQTGSNTAVVYLFSTPQHLELLLVTPTAAPLRKTIAAADREKLSQVIQQFRQEVTDPRKVETKSYLPASQQLYQWLFAPLEPQLRAEKITTLMLCAGPLLRSLPFAALHNGQTFLIENYNFSLIPGFSLTSTNYRDLKQARVLAMGASQFQELPPLPLVPAELQAIMQQKRGISFLNGQFTVPNLENQRRQAPYEVIHLATHAQFRPGAASNSFIQFWDTSVTLDRLRQLGLSNPTLNLLVLSACSTALGDEQAEMGFAGLAVQAGVETAIGSLWAVSDAGTLNLMTNFYQQLKQTNIRAESLRQAQINSLRSNSPSANKVAHPYYWSGFTMIGNPW